MGIETITTIIEGEMTSITEIDQDLVRRDDVGIKIEAEIIIIISTIRTEGKSGEIRAKKDQGPSDPDQTPDKNQMKACHGFWIQTYLTILVRE